MTLPWGLAGCIVWLALTASVAVLPKNSDFVQQPPQPTVQRGQHQDASSLEVSWDSTGDRTKPRILGYDVQYAVAGGSGSSDVLDWQTVEGDGKSTWDVTVRVDGFDRSKGKTHTVQDGWITLALSRVYPKPSPLPDLMVVTEAIGWDDTWAELEAKAQRALTDSGHRQYSAWTVAAVRCDETEQRDSDHWAGGCPFLEYGGYTWHLRFSPPAGVLAAPEEYPVVRVEKETITAKWSGEGNQVVATRYGYSPRVEGVDEGSEASSTDLIDPFFCQRGSCMRSLERLREGTPYIVRLRAYNRNGFGSWKTSTPDASLPSADTMSTATTSATPVPPKPKAPRLSSSTPTSLTVFADTAGDTTNVVDETFQGYEFEVQPYNGNIRVGDTSLWTPVGRDAKDGEPNEALGASPVVTVTGLLPSSSYRFRVSARNGYGLSPVSVISDAFTTGPPRPQRLLFAPTVDASSVTSTKMAVTWSSGSESSDNDGGRGETYAFEAQWQPLGSGLWREAAVTLDRNGEWRATAEGLKAYTQHRFRVRLVNDVGAGEWSAESVWTRTEPDFSYASLEDKTPMSDIPTSMLLSGRGEGETPGNVKDFDYYHGVGNGGKVSYDGGGGKGSEGAAVIIARVPGIPLPSRTTFFYSATPQAYVVPNHSGMTSVTLKLWGAGGGGVLTPAAAADVTGDNSSSNATQVLGGGGGFLQAEVMVFPGETLRVMVGGGGDASTGEKGGRGGFNGGQKGGRGQSGGGGGGGSTSVLRESGQLVAAAGGGGGAGNAATCCAHGGAGGGQEGGDGGSPGSADMASLVGGTGRGEDCQSGWCSADASQVTAVSTEGLENWVTTGGGGGKITRGGDGGNSDVFDWVEGGGGRQGGITSPRGGETSLPIVYKGTSSRAATPGQSTNGGYGADGERAGGGGGGGYYGGGGGGSGRQGGGGGGGSSYADTGALAVAALNARANGGAGVSVVRALKVGETWVEVEWDAVSDAVDGEEPVWYEVEISSGFGGDDFRLAARVDAMDGYNPSVTTLAPRAAGGLPAVALKTVLLGLPPSSDFNVRVVSISRSGPGTPSAALEFSTIALATNVWERVIPRASRLEKGGGGLSGPVLGRPHLGDTDSASFQAAGAFSDPPTELRQAFPAARSGHSLAVVSGKVYMFGGVAASQRCSSAIVGSTALGDTPGGAAVEDCIKGDSFSAELWEFDPSIKVWTEIVVNGTIPTARDGHTASVAGSKMIVFGGRGNTSATGQTTLLGDEWEIDLDPSLTVAVTTNSSTAIPEGTPTFIPLILDQTMFDTDMCVSDMSVTVDIDHPCTGQLHVTLYGPGPSTQDANLLENTARAEPAVLFFGYNGTDDGFANDGFANMGSTGEGGSGGGCGDGMRVSFSDSAEDGVWECCGQGSPFTGMFKPVDRLLIGRYLRMPAAGEWTLEVLDSAADGINGTVREWSISVEMRPCDWQSALRWSNITGNEHLSPSPRLHHIAAIVDEGFYVSGGTGKSGALFDLWRRGEITTASLADWVLLAEGSNVPLASAGPMKPYGASVLVSPWGLLSVGGMLQRGGVGMGSDIWVVDPVSKLWRSVSIGNGSSLPAGRYQSAAAIMRAKLSPGTRSGDSGFLMLFGGKDDWRRLDDLWRFQLNSLDVSTSRSAQVHQHGAQPQGVWHTAVPPDSEGGWSLAETGRDARCAHILVSGTSNNTWQGSCGAGAVGGEDGACTMKTVLDMAWCLGEYQGVGSP